LVRKKYAKNAPGGFRSPPDPLHRPKGTTTPLESPHDYYRHCDPGLDMGKQFKPAKPPAFCRTRTSKSLASEALGAARDHTVENDVVARNEAIQTQKAKGYCSVNLLQWSGSPRKVSCGRLMLAMTAGGLTLCFANGLPNFVRRDDPHRVDCPRRAAMAAG